MKLFPAIALVVLASACSDHEDQVKDLRNHDDIELDDDVIEDDSTSDTVEDSADGDTTETQDAVANSEWSYEVTSTSENNWGYKILQKGIAIIDQKTIPSVQGIDGFDTKEKAERTAKFILEKVEKGIFPPTVDKEDLEKLGVLRD